MGKLHINLFLDRDNTVAAEVISELLEIPGFVNAVIPTIPDNWEYAETDSGSNPTKKNFVYAFLWEQISNNSPTFDELSEEEKSKVEDLPQDSFKS